jgi:hypothetical protein
MGLNDFGGYYVGIHKAQGYYGGILVASTGRSIYNIK